MSDTAALIDTALKVANLIALFGGGGIIITRITRMATRFEYIGEAQSNEISKINVELIEMRKLMTEVAVQKTRIDLMDRRYEELRHGEGFVFPLESHLGKRV